MRARARELLVESRFEENFAALIAAIFHRRAQQCCSPVCKKTNVSGSILRRRYRGRKRNARCTRERACALSLGTIKRGTYY